MLSSPLLIICGPTATGKTSFALTLASHIPLEIISADSRQVYQGLDLVTGKDIPTGFSFHSSSLQFLGRPLPRYLNSLTAIWGLDLVRPDEDFSVSLWHQFATLVISDIQARGSLPVVVGGTGLYIKSLLSDLSSISIPPNPEIRHRFAHQSADQLFNYLKQTNPLLASSLNYSDSRNPRRLIRAIERSLSPPPIATPSPAFTISQIGLDAPAAYLDRRIASRVLSRLALGAAQEAQTILSRYSHHLPSVTASGYRAFLTPNPITEWQKLERQYSRRQRTWFKKQGGISWYDVSLPAWQAEATTQVINWYNHLNDQKD